jgi:hypothetical protein
MGFRRVLAFAFLFSMAVAAGSQPKPQADAASPVSNGTAIDGVWRAQDQGLPFVTLNLNHEEGTLNGAILFYLHLRETGQPVTSSAGIPEPILHPNFDGKVLTFAVSHRQAHARATLATPPVQFTVILEGPGKAQLYRDKDPSAKVEMVRDPD